MKYFLIAALVTLIAALIFIPLGYMERGSFAFGGEWILILFIAWLAFTIAFQLWRRGHEE